MTAGSLFSGVGTLDLGFERAGFEIRWMCEINEYRQSELRKHWPDTPIYDDVRDIESPPPIDCLTGGVPCQPTSQAAARSTRGDDWLWPEMLRVAKATRPDWIVLENPEGLRYAGRGLDRILFDLAALGYDAEWRVLQSSAFGAPHHRARIWVVAYPNGHSQPDGALHAAETPVLQQFDPTIRTWPDPPADIRMDAGTPRRMDRLRALGDAVQVEQAEFVARCIREHALTFTDAERDA